MESFRRLGDEEGMCRLLAFTKKQQGGIISAAFEYSDFSLEELLEVPLSSYRPGNTIVNATNSTSSSSRACSI